AAAGAAAGAATGRAGFAAGGAIGWGGAGAGAGFGAAATGAGFATFAFTAGAPALPAGAINVLANVSCGAGASPPAAGLWARSRAANGSWTSGDAAWPRDSIRLPTITPSTNSMHATTAL